MAGSEIIERPGARVLLLGASDERLVALARAGDEQAFAAIVERYRAPLLRYCRGFLSPTAAEDALQQTLINAYGALTGGTARAPVALRPWLYRVAHNAALNVARDPQAGLEQLPEGLDGVERPDEVVQQRERLRRVVGAVRALPPKQRQVIVRNALDGDSHERIATDLGVSAGSIRQLARSRSPQSWPAPRAVARRSCPSTARTGRRDVRRSWRSITMLRRHRRAVPRGEVRAAIPRCTGSPAEVGRARPGAARTAAARGAEPLRSLGRPGAGAARRSAGPAVPPPARPRRAAAPPGLRGVTRRVTAPREGRPRVDRLAAARRGVGPPAVALRGAGRPGVGRRGVGPPGVGRPAAACREAARRRVPRPAVDRPAVPRAAARRGAVPRAGTRAGAARPRAAERLVRRSVLRRRHFQERVRTAAGSSPGARARR